VKILILGAGQVGSSVAQNLSHEDNDITIVDHNIETLRNLQERLDIRTINGHASHPSVLNQAAAEDTDLLIALTNSDEVNMIACQVAYTLFRTPTKIARVRSAEYLRHSRELFLPDALPIDVMISPEQLVTDSIHRLMEYPGALQVLDFADGKVSLVGVKAYYGGPLVGQALRTLPSHMPGIHTRVAAIFRQGSAIIPEGDTLIQADDEVFFIAANKNIRAIMSELRRLDKQIKRIILAGGGNIGSRLAQALEHDHQVKVIENNRAVALRLSERLARSIVLAGNAADEELLIEENIENTDVFCAVTNDDEANILSAMLAKRLGAHKVMALINRMAYVDLVEASGVIDAVISPQQATIGSLLSHVRRGDVVKVHSLRRGAAEAIEAIAHGDRSTSRVVGRRIEQIPLPPGTTIAALVRGNHVLICHHDTVIEAEDHAILFLTDKRYLRDVERLFQVHITFI